MNKRTFGFSLLASGAFSLALMVAAPAAHALTLTPADTTCTTDINSELTEAQLEGLILTCFGATVDVSLAYKHEVDGGNEEGPFAGSYDTTYFNEPDDPQEALIEWLSGQPAISCPTCYLVVKDGNQDPAQYIFDLNSWNGTDDIELLDFWPQQGAISHVSIWRADEFSEQIPEPGSLALLGLGLVGLAAMRRRR